MNRMQFEHASKFKYLGCVLDEVSTDEVESRRKVASGRRIAGAIRSLINSMGLQFESDRVLHESLLVPVLKYGSETMIWTVKRSRIRAVHMDR